MDYSTNLLRRNFWIPPLPNTYSLVSVLSSWRRAPRTDTTSWTPSSCWPGRCAAARTWRSSPPLSSSGEAYSQIWSLNIFLTNIDIIILLMTETNWLFRDDKAKGNCCTSSRRGSVRWKQHQWWKVVTEFSVELFFPSFISFL